MKVFELIAISLGLSLDAFAVAIASGCAVRRTLRIGYALRIAACFGLAQMLMPILGWLGGRGVRDAVAAVDHWIAFGLSGALLMVAAGVALLLPGRRPPALPTPQAAG